MVDLFQEPIKKTKVRKNVYAYKYPNWCINIEWYKYYFYSMAEAIKLWRHKNPIT